MMPTMLPSGTNSLWLACLLAGSAVGCERFTAPKEVRQAERLLLVERLDAAATTLDRFLQQQPGNADGLRLRFFLFLKNENHPDALTTYRLLPTGNLVLPAALAYRDAQVRANAARLICENNLPIATTPLIQALDDSDPAVRRYGAELLGRRKETTAFKPLFRLLGDDNWYVRAKAAEALGLIGNPHAAGWLVQLLNENDSLVRWNATVALRRLADESNQAVLRRAFPAAKPAKQLALAVALAKLHDPLAFAPLTNSVPATDATTRRYVAEALGDFPLEQTREHLQRLAEDADPSVREEAQRSLQRSASNGRGL